MSDLVEAFREIHALKRRVLDLEHAVEGLTPYFRPKHDGTNQDPHLEVPEEDGA